MITTIKLIKITKTITINLLNHIFNNRKKEMIALQRFKLTILQHWKRVAIQLKEDLLRKSETLKSLSSTLSRYFGAWK